MGLIKAALGAFSGTMSDQWKEFFYCESIPNEILVIKGKKRVGGRSSNTKSDDNIITQGSGIAVADGQCMMIVEQGKVVEFCNEPGEYTFDSSTEPTIFNGGLNKENLLKTLETVGKRFSYGGDTGKDQRVYYFNMKEIMDNKFGTQTPVSFKVVDKNVGLDADLDIRCNGVYSYKITNPMLFFTNVSGNVSNTYDRSEIDTQLKSEFIAALMPAFAKISSSGMRPSDLTLHSPEISEAMKEVLTKKWTELRGISIVSVAINSVTLTEEDKALLKNAQRTAMFANTNMAAAASIEAQNEALKMAASNQGGAMMGFMGMNMANQAGGGNAQSLFEMHQQQQQQQSQQAQQTSSSAWICSCGQSNTAKFCSNCGLAKPVPTEGWTCSCGNVNQGKFCSQCGSPKPAGAPLYKCDKCGYQLEDPTKPPKFCPECGDIFDENDVVK